MQRDIRGRAHPDTPVTTGAAASLATCVLLALGGGCARLPHLYRSIELGKPLDRFKLPEGVMVVEDLERGTLTLTERHQILLPVGLVRYALEIHHGPQGEVTCVQLEEYYVSYWVLLVAGGESRRERRLDANGAPQERRLRWRPLGIVTPLNGLLLFYLAVDQCFCEAARFQKVSPAASQPATGPASAGSGP